MRAWVRRTGRHGSPARTSVSARARLEAPVRSRKFPFDSFIWLPPARCSVASGPGWLQFWFQAAALRAGIRYLFAADLTILSYWTLGNGGSARRHLVDAQPLIP